MLAIDANKKLIRMVLTDNNDKVVNSFVGTSWETDAALNFLTRYGVTQVAASPLQNWPEELYPSLRNSGIDIWYLPPSLLREAHIWLSDWRQKRLLHRARLLAHVASRIDRHGYTSALDAVLSCE